MTALEQIKFCAQIQIGTEIKVYSGVTMVVIDINKKYISGYSKEQYVKNGSTHLLILRYETIMNPHYNKYLSII